MKNTSVDRGDILFSVVSGHTGIYSKLPTKAKASHHAPVPDQIC